MDDHTAKEAAREWKRRLNPPPRVMNRVGSNRLSALWMGGYKDIDQLKRWKRYVGA
jgi:hypothetical protein